jgi:hypothetical protein
MFEKKHLIQIQVIQRIQWQWKIIMINYNDTMNLDHIDEEDNNYSNNQPNHTLSEVEESNSREINQTQNDNNNMINQVQKLSLKELKSHVLTAIIHNA